MRAYSKRYPLNQIEKISNLKALTDRGNTLFGNNVAFKKMLSKTEFKSITYKEFTHQLCALANALIDSGWQNSRIALVGENSYEWVLAYFAIVNIGATVVPIDKELSEKSVCELIERSGATVFIHSEKYDEEAVYTAKNIKDLCAISLGEKVSAKHTLGELILKGEEILASGIDRYSDIEIDCDKVCAILFTSGTTGRSKGVMLSHKNLASDLVAACELASYNEDDVFISILPINHAYENMGGIFGALYFGASVGFCEGVKYLVAALALFRPTVMVLVPLYLETFSNRIWDRAKKEGKDKKLKTGILVGNILAALGINVRDRLLADVRKFFGGRLSLIVCGGASLNPDLVKMYKGFGITVLQGYGITECSPIISVNRNKCLKASSVGWVISCNQVSFDSDGQILVKGDNVMQGYLDDDAATAEAFDGEWFKTGDLGYMDKDGFLYVTGRCKNLIMLKNGKNVMPDEIESLLQQSPLVLETVVKEISSIDGIAESIMAIIYPDPATTKGVDTRSLCAKIQQEIDELNQKLVYYKRIKSFVLRDSEFPKTTTKKIQRYKVG